MTDFERQHYSRAPIAEALIDLRVSDPAAVNLQALDNLADQLAETFPTRLPIQQYLMGIQADADNPDSTTFTNNREMHGWRLISKDQDRVLQLQRAGLTYSHLPPYTDWNTFRGEAQRYWNAYRDAASITSVSRIAVRVINHIPVPAGEVDLEKYLTVFPVVPESLPSSANALFVQLQLSVPQVHQDARVIINVASGQTNEKGPHLVLDIDLFVERTIANDDDIWSTLEIFGLQKDTIFEGCITDEVRKVIR